MNMHSSRKESVIKKARLHGVERLWINSSRQSLCLATIPAIRCIHIGCARVFVGKCFDNSSVINNGIFARQHVERNSQLNFVAGIRLTS